MEQIPFNFEAEVPPQPSEEPVSSEKSEGYIPAEIKKEMDRLQADIPALRKQWEAALKQAMFNLGYKEIDEGSGPKAWPPIDN